MLRDAGLESGRVPRHLRDGAPDDSDGGDDLEGSRGAGRGAPLAPGAAGQLAGNRAAAIFAEIKTRRGKWHQPKR